jgi:hypothetical protein
MKLEFYEKNSAHGPGAVTHSCNPSYLGDREIGKIAVEGHLE